MSISGLVVGTYLAVLLVLAVYGFHRTVAGLAVLPEPRTGGRARSGRFSELPAVTVQLPLFNEMYVVERLLDAVARHPLPARPLPDPGARRLAPTRRRRSASARSPSWRARFPELDIEYIHRTDRTGFKAGALRERPAAPPRASSS